MKQEIYSKAIILTLDEVERYLEDCLYLVQYFNQKDEITSLLLEIGKIIEAIKQLLEAER